MGVVATMETSLDALAFSATARCLTGCAIGEVLGMVIGTALAWGDYATIAPAVVFSGAAWGTPSCMPAITESG